MNVSTGHRLGWSVFFLGILMSAAGVFGFVGKPFQVAGIVLMIFGQIVREIMWRKSAKRAPNG